MDSHLERLRRLREQAPHLQGFLKLAEGILLEKDRTKQVLPETFAPDPQRAGTRLAEGVPYLSPREFPLDPKGTGQYFLRLLKILAESEPARHEGLIRRMEASRFSYESSLRRLLEEPDGGSDLAGEWGEEGSLLFFFLVQSCQPSFEKAAERWRGEVGEPAWERGYCPFCGGFPSLGEIRAEGERRLHCTLCATEWRHPRLRCPYCGNGEQEKLTYFQVEGEGEYRVDVCLRCRQYLKTVDVRERAGALSAAVEDWLTLHLDQLAQQEGYHRSAALYQNSSESGVQSSAISEGTPQSPPPNFESPGNPA